MGGIRVLCFRMGYEILAAAGLRISSKSCHRLLAAIRRDADADHPT